MKYVSGMQALNTNCSLVTCGDWHSTSQNWDKLYLLESDKSVFKDWGIEGPKDIPNNEKQFYVANHIRALLDFLEMGNYALPGGMRNDYICNEAYTPVIFEKVYELRNADNWDGIDAFMKSEYYMKWVTYCNEADKKTGMA